MAIAAGCGVVVRYVERDGDRLYNAAVAFGTMGEELAHYRKVQLYGPREKALFTPGDAYATFTLAGTKTALLICYDIEFGPHITALMAGDGVDLVPDGRHGALYLCRPGEGAFDGRQPCADDCLCQLLRL